MKILTDSSDLNNASQSSGSSTLSKSNKISTGSFDLNKWLNGGYETDVITMIAGPPGSGKTNFCILSACSQAKQGKKIIFIDTEGGFSVERVKQIVGENHEKILENIFLLEPTSFEEQKKSFSKLLSKLKKEHVGLIIVDSMAMLYRLELGDAAQADSESKSKVPSTKNVEQKGDSKIKEINGEVAKQMRILAEISRKQKIPVLITNQVYGSFISGEDWQKGIKGEVNLVGGDLFKYWSKCIIELKNDGGKKKAILLKHRNIGKKEISFEIKDLGIFKKRWL